MPIPEELFNNIGDSNIFTIVDLKQGFNQIVFDVKDCKKTSFCALYIYVCVCIAFWSISFSLFVQ
jgi:hypothetical protein